MVSRKSLPNRTTKI